MYDVYEVAIFYGKSKPKSADDYLEDSIKEINELQNDGIIIQGKHFDLKLKCFICDTPARAFSKCTLGHGDTEACERCEILGKRVQSRTVYPDTEAQERTDASFRNSRQVKHHHGPSPLLRILPPINMVMIFVLDFMHLCCNGIMKKLIEYWMSVGLICKLDVRSRLELGRRMESIKSQIPLEFQRKTRSTSFIEKRKATELRFFYFIVGQFFLSDF